MREIKFRAYHPEEKKMYEIDLMNYMSMNEPSQDDEMPHTARYNGLMQFTGLRDKNGKEIFEGDIVRVRRPYRTTQTHTGDNIPNGSYTEPLEPGIKELELEVKFEDGTFFLDGEDGPKDIRWPITWEIQEWTEESIKEAIAFRGTNSMPWDDPEEGDLTYLLQEYKLKDLNELIDYLNGCEVIGNIYETPE
jgi:hypothetical protein